MSTLAHDFLKHTTLEGFLKSSDSKVLQILKVQTYYAIKSRLVAPRLGSHPDVTRCAERFVFEQDPTTVITSLINNKSIDGRIPLKTAKLPCPNMWIEYAADATDKDGKPHPLDIGYAVATLTPSEAQGIGTPGCVMAMCCRTSKDIRLLGSLVVPKLPITLDVNGNSSWMINWFCDKAGKHLTEEMLDDARDITAGFINSLFMINVPKVAEFREHVMTPKQHKLRDTQGTPFVEYKRVHIKIGQSRPQYHTTNTTTAGEDTGRRHKFHQVIGHFRNYKKDDVDDIRYIPEYWRGDPALGMILKERVMKG